MSNAVRVRNQLKEIEIPKTSKERKKAQKAKENQRDVADRNRNEAKGHEKKLEGGEFAVFTKKSQFLAAVDKSKGN